MTTTTTTTTSSSTTSSCSADPTKFVQCAPWSQPGHCVTSRADKDRRQVALSSYLSLGWPPAWPPATTPTTACPSRVASPGECHDDTDLLLVRPTGAAPPPPTMGVTWDYATAFILCGQKLAKVCGRIGWKVAVLSSRLMRPSWTPSNSCDGPLRPRRAKQVRPLSLFTSTQPHPTTRPVWLADAIIWTLRRKVTTIIVVVVVVVVGKLLRAGNLATTTSLPPTAS